MTGTGVGRSFVQLLLNDLDSCVKHKLENNTRQLALVPFNYRLRKRQQLQAQDPVVAVVEAVIITR